jgi:hypothetical protein
MEQTETKKLLSPSTLSQTNVKSSFGKFKEAAIRERFAETAGITSGN